MNHHEIIKTLQAFRQKKQMHTHYCVSRLESLHERDMVYPSWYLAPSRFSEGEDQIYGTRQGRITCSNPPLQTDPKEIMQTMATRFNPGHLVRMDLKQIELVVAGLLSADPVMLDGMSDGGDLHTQRAIDYWGPDIVNAPDFDKKRHTAKQTNFLIIYRGNARVLASTLMRRVGMRVPLYECKRIINKAKRVYRGLWQWQDKLIRQATVDGYITEPILGYRRWLTTSGMTNRGILESIICNFRIQCVAACTACDLQSYVVEHLERHKMKSRLIMNRYDALEVDCPTDELPPVKTILAESLTHCDYWSKIEELAGRSWPLVAKTEVTDFLP